MIYTEENITKFILSWEDITRMIYNEYNIIIPKPLDQTSRFFENDLGKLAITWSKIRQIPQSEKGSK